jgi:hypothetical protein
LPAPPESPRKLTNSKSPKNRISEAELKRHSIGHSNVLVDGGVRSNEGGLVAFPFANALPLLPEAESDDTADAQDADGESAQDYLGLVDPLPTAPMSTQLATHEEQAPGATSGPQEAA